MQPQSTQPSATPTTKPERRYDVDWLRLLAVFLLYTFHTARVFDSSEQFYIQNAPFLYALIALPLFLYLNGPSGRRLIGRLAEGFSRRARPRLWSTMWW